MKHQQFSIQGGVRHAALSFPTRGATKRFPAFGRHGEPARGTVERKLTRARWNKFAKRNKNMPPAGWECVARPAGFDPAIRRRRRIGRGQLSSSDEPRHRRRPACFDRSMNWAPRPCPASWVWLVRPRSGYFPCIRTIESIGRSRGHERGATSRTDGQMPGEGRGPPGSTGNPLTRVERQASQNADSSRPAVAGASIDQAVGSSIDFVFLLVGALAKKVRRASRPRGGGGH